jgi:hypothetical protein
VPDVLTADDARVLQESLLILLTGLIERAADLLAHSDALSRMEEVASLCDDAHSVAVLALTVTARTA